MLLAPLLASVTLSLGDTSLSTLRSRPVDRSVALDLQNTARAALTFGFDHSSVDLFYSPSLGVIDVTRDGQFVLMQSAGVDYAWWTRRLRLDFAVVGSLGRQSFLGFGTAPLQPGAAVGNGGTDNPAPAPGAGTPDANPGAAAPNAAYLAQQEVIYTGTLRASFSLSYDLSRRWSTTAGVGYSVSGGLGSSKEFLPLRRGPDANTAWTYRLTRADTLTTSLTAAYFAVPSLGSRYYTATLLETWSHRFAPLTVGSLGAGVTYLQSKVPATDTERSVLGAGLANISQGYKLEDHSILELGAGAVLGTGYNQVLGTVTQQVSGFARVAWSKGDFSLVATGDASESLPRSSPTATRVFGAGIVATQQVVDPLTLMLGGRWTHQVLPETAVLAGIHPDQWQLFAGVTLTAPQITF